MSLLFIYQNFFLFITFTGFCFSYLIFIRKMKNASFRNAVLNRTGIVGHSSITVTNKNCEKQNQARFVTSFFILLKEIYNCK